MFSLISLSCLLLLASCENLQPLTGPSSLPNSSGSSFGTWDRYGCVLVQTPGGPQDIYFNIQMEVAKRLKSRGHMNWIRLPAFPDSHNRHYFEAAVRAGFRIFGIISLSHIEQGSSWESVFDLFVRTYPEVEVWEIGGEITSPIINPGAVMNAKTYMKKLTNLYHYAIAKHSRIDLMSGPPEGNTSPDGPVMLQNFIDHGLLELKNIIVAINIYSPYSLIDYERVIDHPDNKKIKNMRLWVAETGTPHMENHRYWGTTFYEDIEHALNPERVCWYTMYGGDQKRNGDWPHSLITNLEDLSREYLSDPNPNFERYYSRTLRSELLIDLMGENE